MNTTRTTAPTTQRTAEPDCFEVTRPTTDESNEPDAVAPASYPGPPSDRTDESDLTGFAESFERAFRRNGLVREHGGDLVEFGFTTDETWTENAPDDGGVAGVEYRYHYTLRDGVIADSPTNVAVYYVDASVAVRAHARGRRDAGTEPDPMEEGVTVACFD